MPTSLKIGIGAAITFLGLAGLFYTMPILSNAVASDGPVYKEANVPELPDAMKMYVPLEIEAAGAVIIGIAITGIGLGETLSPPTAMEKIIKMLLLKRKKKKAQQTEMKKIKSHGRNRVITAHIDGMIIEV